MLVLSRKKNEAILIDGLIKITVLNLTKGMVRVQVSAPKSTQLIRGLVRHELRATEDASSKTIPIGEETLHLTMVNQQVISLGEAINVGIVDADRSRGLFFVDAPVGSSVLALERREIDSKKSLPRQNLLQFMGQGQEKLDDERQKPNVKMAPREDPEPADSNVPHLLPFPSRPADRDRVNRIP
jgi:carbon storage regulator CsrA